MNNMIATAIWKIRASVFNFISYTLCCAGPPAPSRSIIMHFKVRIIKLVFREYDIKPYILLMFARH